MSDKPCPHCASDIRIGYQPGACPECGGLGSCHPVGAYLNRLFHFPGTPCAECGETGVCPVCDGSGIVDRGTIEENR